jgi:hypothetical protein
LVRAERVAVAQFQHVEPVRTGRVRRGDRWGPVAPRGVHAGPVAFRPGLRVEARAVDVDGVRLDVTRHDPVAQTLVSQQIAMTADGIRLYPVRLRYIWPRELDLMAQLAGLRLVQLAGGWRGKPVTAESGSHVCVYQAATA